MIHPAFEHLTMPEDAWVTMSERGRKDFIENFLTYGIVQTIQSEDGDLDKTVGYRLDDESQTDDTNPLMILAATASKIATTKKVKPNTITVSNAITTMREMASTNENNSETRITPAGKENTLQDKFCF